jgi:microcystin-dependent protein
MDIYLGTILAFAFGYAPQGFAVCYGQELSVSQNQALFSLLSNKYGGNGTTNFALPDLRGRSIVGQGQGPGLTNIPLGQAAGVEGLALTINNLPAHIHTLTNGAAVVTTTVQTVDNGNESIDSGNGANALGTGGNMVSIYREQPSGTDHIAGVTSVIRGATGVAGNSIPIYIRNPYLGLCYCIATEGIYPVRP